MQLDNYINTAENEVVVCGAASPHSHLKLSYTHSGNTYHFTLTNNGDTAFPIQEIILFRGKQPFAADTRLCGESYQKLSFYDGTIEQTVSLTNYTDAGHYKLIQKKNFHTVYNMLQLSAKDGNALIGFSSCHRFSGEIRYNKDILEIALNTEGILLQPGETWELEELFLAEDMTQSELLHAFSTAIMKNHPTLATSKPPAGWCSWYCYGPNVTEEDIMQNIDDIKQKIPALENIQIDDGYQPYMGDWLIPSDKFSDMKALCQGILNRGLQPAIWVAPFIAEKDSALFTNHPDWFVKDEDGCPLPSDRVSFGGWRCGPWYMLDGTHPGALEFLTDVFRTMREQWGCRYFKLDANMWGALPFGKRYDTNATAVEAYRAGMKAILKGSGEDSFLLGCNAPMWPSLGMVHGMRVTNDISRKWKTFRELASVCFRRNWQHKTLWINDPDCLVLTNMPVNIMGPDGVPVRTLSNLNDDEFMYHASYILASGGSVLSGDKLADLSPAQLQVIQKILDYTGVPAEFDDMDYQTGRAVTKHGTLLFAFNADEQPTCRTISSNGNWSALDFWTDETMGTFHDQISLNVPPHSCRVLLCKAL